MTIAEIGDVDHAARAVNHRRLRAAVTAVSSLSAADVDGMFELYAAYYDGTTRALFEHDLLEKHWVVALHGARGELAGFSTLAVSDVAADGAAARIVYSGDTIIDRPYWGTQALAFTWIRFAGTLKAQAPERPLYWFLIAKGHRTYRYMSTFAIDFFPHWSKATPAPARRLIDDLARDRFGDAYRSDRGVVSFPQSRGHLKAPWTQVEPDELARLDVAFFLRSNPGYVRGDELACLTELAPANLRPIARRVFEQGMGG
ncbi:MAG TPA: hypothetical protein VKX28_08410 [Xanthobacteraceae bacterium]|nr:hypothetical protein [Xanthobacteraceae bacterium]